jgi:hypothetical protein
MKLLALTVCAILLGVGVYLWQSEIGDDEIFVLPKGYKGVVVILYNQKNGQPVRYEKGKRVYEIPLDGVLRTQFDINEGWHGIGKYFYTENGRRVEIPYKLDGKDPMSSMTQVCCNSSGKSYRNDNGEPVEFAQFYVGTKEEIDAAIEKGEKLHPADLIKSIK